MVVLTLPVIMPSLAVRRLLCPRLLLLRVIRVWVRLRRLWVLLLLVRVACVVNGRR